MSDIPILGDLKLPAWSLWTPELFASTTNPTRGTGGTLPSGTFIRMGSVVLVNGAFVFGTSGVAAGNGVYELTLPVGAKAGQGVIGHGYIYDASANSVQLIHLVPAPGVPLRVYPRTGSGTTYAVQHNVPWTWAASDSLSWFAMYEAA